MRYDRAMTKSFAINSRYIDAQGREWDTAEEALQDFIDNLPPLTDEQREEVFSSTHHDWPASRNLAAIEFAVHYHGLSEVFGYYPIPYPLDPQPIIHYQPARDALINRGIEDQGWTWDSINDKFMVAVDVDWDIAHVPFFQEQRQYHNRRVLASLGPPYAPPASLIAEEYADFVVEKRPAPKKRPPKKE